MAGHKIPHLQFRGGTFYFRVVIPKDIVRKTGAKEIKLSLKTRIPEEARRRCQIASIGFQGLFSGIELMEGITKKQIYEMGRNHFRMLMERVDDVAPSPVARHHYSKKIQEYALGRQKELKNGSFSKGTESYAKGYLKNLGIDKPNEDSPEFSQLCQVILRAELERARILKSLADKGYLIEPEDVLFKDVKLVGDIGSQYQYSEAASIVATSNEPFEKVLERFLEKGAIEKWRPRTQNLYKRLFKWFKEFLGNSQINITDIRIEVLRDFQDAISNLPKNMDKNSDLKGKSIRQIIASSSDLPKISTKTKQNYHAAFMSFWNWCVDQKYMAINPCPSSPKFKKQNSMEAKDPFNIEQLKKIFSSPIYTGCRNSHYRYKKGDAIILDGYYWIPLIALYSGMRGGEILQLQMKDFKQHNDEIYYFDLNEEGKFPDSDTQPKKLKTTASKRLVPIHPKLKELGLIEHLNKLKRKPQERIFYEIRLGNKDDYTHYYSKRFRSFLDSIESKTPKTSFHSFRHNAIDALKRKQVSLSYRNELFGHENKDIGDSVYGSQSVERVYETVKMIEYDLDFSHLKKFKKL